MGFVYTVGQSLINWPLSRGFLVSRDAFPLWRSGRKRCMEVRIREKYGLSAKTKRGGRCTKIAVNGGSTELCKCRN